MDNWVMLMEQIDEIKVLEGLQDNNNEGFEVGEIVSIGKVKCVEVKAPEYYPSGEGEESKTFKEKIEEFYKNNKKVIWLVGLGLGGFIKLVKSSYDSYMIKNYYIDDTYISRIRKGPTTTRIIEKIDEYLKEEMSKGKISYYLMNEDSKYFIYDVEVQGEREMYKLMPRDYGLRILSEMEHFRRVGQKINISDDKYMSTLVSTLVKDYSRYLRILEYEDLRRIIIQNNKRRERKGLAIYF